MATTIKHAHGALAPAESFVRRHIGPTEADVADMLAALGYDSMDALIDATIPAGIRYRSGLNLPDGRSESQVLADFRAMAAKNRVFRSFIGMGYSDCVTPPVIQRSVLENPAWYTAYTPYQAEIAQGRLEALLNFQTMVIDLTALEIANASLLDEATAAAEAMTMSYGIKGHEGKQVYFVSDACHQQTIGVVRTRAAARRITVRVDDIAAAELDAEVFGVLLQYPTTDGAVLDYRDICEKAHVKDALVTVAADLLSLTLLVPPGEWGADVVVGNTQRFGVPLGYGGPHAAYFATRDEFKRQIPGRIIGVSRDADGKPALRMALQTREQHIRREKATSNVCTAQVLLAVVASMYAVWHGPRGLRRVASRVHQYTAVLAEGLKRLGHSITHEDYFDTIRVELRDGAAVETLQRAAKRGINVRLMDEKSVCIALDETVRDSDLNALFEIFGGDGSVGMSLDDAAEATDPRYDERFKRTTPFMTHPVFNTHCSETEILRYMHKLESRDLSLVHSMIPLGSCTMKLNATAEMMPITWRGFSKLHPFAPVDQAEGYRQLFDEIESALREITGFAAISLQPNAGPQGEYAGLLAIHGYHASRSESHRDVCLIPQSAHGTNPASAVMAGMKVVVVRTDERGNIDVADLRAKAEQHSADLAALMVTYPSTHGVFEEGIVEICSIVHEHGADVCHLNLHKTFCIPHGGGGPGMGPIGVASHLIPFLPGHSVIPLPGKHAVGAVSSAPWGSASILPISMAYIRLMGGPGLELATKVAILNANYIAKRLDVHFPLLYKGVHGTVGHECIIDTRVVKGASGVDVEDIAKRLMDYGFHAPTVSFPVSGTLMVEPTESESKGELDRFCEAMISIREEIREIEAGTADRKDNVLKNAPHTLQRVTANEWTHSYTRERAAFPAEWTRDSKFWPAVARVESAYGDRNLMCSCPPVEAYAG